MTSEERAAARQIVQTARDAPELYTPTLLDTLLGLATDTAKPTVFDALGALVRRT